MVERKTNMKNPTDSERTGTPAVAMQRIVSQPHRVQLSRKKGWKLPPNTVVVSRPTKWGNPFKVSKTCPAKNAVCLYKQWMRFEGYAIALAAKVALRGKNLACWCALDAPCHADVLLRLANESSSATAGDGSGGAQPKESK